MHYGPFKCDVMQQWVYKLAQISVMKVHCPTLLALQDVYTHKSVAWMQESEIPALDLIELSVDLFF